MRRHLLALAFLALPLAASSAGDLPLGKPEDVGMSSERLRRVDDVIARYVDAKKVSGAVTLVARGGRVVHYEAQGVMDVESKTPMRTDSIFRMASSTKPVTGVAILMLIEEGKVGLTDPVSKYLPEFKGIKVAVEKDGEVQLVAAEREITIRDLMTHTSGLLSGGAGQKKAGAGFLPRRRRGCEPGRGRDQVRGGPARLPARHSLAVQRPGRHRPAGEDRRGRLGPVVRRLPQDAASSSRSAWSTPSSSSRRIARTASPRSTAGPRTGWRRSPSFIRFPETYTSGAGGPLLDRGRLLPVRPDAGQRRRARRQAAAQPPGRRADGLEPGRRPVRGPGRAAEGDGLRPDRRGRRRPRRRPARSARRAASAGTAPSARTSGSIPREKLVAVLLVQTSGRDLHRDFETAVMQSIVRIIETNP